MYLALRLLMQYIRELLLKIRQHCVVVFLQNNNNVITMHPNDKVVITGNKITFCGACKLSHKQFRALLKKFRRKFKRQALAQQREKEEKAEHEEAKHLVELEREENLREEYEEHQRQKLHRLWMQREEAAQLEFQKKQAAMEKKMQKDKEELEKLNKEKETNASLQSPEDLAKTTKRQKEETLKQVISSLPEGNEPCHNPIAPKNYVAREREVCQFYMKTGACRFGESCSRDHPRPASSCTLLVKGMYNHFRLDRGILDDFDMDIGLEFDDRETYDHFKDFYDDVLPEFKKLGRVIQFKVCCNYEPHLRGNVYVQFSNEYEAKAAYQAFNGRYYAGKQLSCEFTSVIKWRSAICGLFHRNKCPKGHRCNFLHVFRNPDNEFWAADRDIAEVAPHSSYRGSNRNSSRYSRSHGSPEESRRRQRRSSRRHSMSNSRSRSRSPVSSRKRKQDSRSRSRTPASSKRRKQRSRSRSRSPLSSKRWKRDSRSCSRSIESSPKHKQNHRYHSSSPESREEKHQHSRSCSKSPRSSHKQEQDSRSRLRSPRSFRRHKRSSRSRSQSSESYQKPKRIHRSRSGSPVSARANHVSRSYLKSPEIHLEEDQNTRSCTISPRSSPKLKQLSRKRRDHSSRSKSKSPESQEDEDSRSTKSSHKTKRDSRLSHKEICNQSLKRKSSKKSKHKKKHHSKKKSKKSTASKRKRSSSSSRSSVSTECLSPTPHRESFSQSQEHEVFERTVRTSHENSVINQESC